MENSRPIIFEISSDEESDFLEASGGGVCVPEDPYWLSELFQEVSKNTDDDSDDVVFVSEVLSNPPKKSRLNYLKPSAGVGGYDDDDDCVVLDGDPDKPTLTGNIRTDDDNDDVEIVGEKGEVACRDFPHARHLCVKFPFGSTAHEVHCGQCHCYVCDSIAPCAQWGSGISSIDHCHATDKDKCWTSERKIRKEGHKPVPVISDIRKPGLLPGITQAHQNSLLTNQISSPSISHLHPVSSNTSMPNAFSQSRRYLPNTPRYKPQSQLVSTQLQTSNVTVRQRSYNPENTNSRLHPSRVPFKRSGIAFMHGSEKGYSGPQLSKEPPLGRCHGIRTSNQQNIRNCNITVGNISIGVTNSTVAQLKLPVPPSYPIRHPATQPQMPSQPNQSSNYVNPVPFYPHVASQPSQGSFQNTSLSQPAQNQSDAGVSFTYQLHPQPNMGNTFENQYFPLHAYNNNPSSSSLINGQTDFQQGGQSQSDLDTRAADFAYDWDDGLKILLETSQLQSAADNFQNANVASVVDFHQQYVAPGDSLSILDVMESQFAGTSNTWEDYGWMFDNHPSPGTICEVPLSPIFPS